MTRQYTITKQIHRETPQWVFHNVMPCMHYDDCKQIKYIGKYEGHKGLSRELRNHLSSSLCPRHFQEHMDRIEEIKNG